jgi:hypothetical protein
MRERTVTNLRRCFKLRVTITLALLYGAAANANDVEPRLYSNVPTGINFISVGYAHSKGEVTFDSSIPVEDVDGEIDSMVLSYSRGLNIRGRSALLTLALPYADVRLTGLLLGEPASGQRQGRGDPQVRLAVNFYGAPATSIKEFSKYQQKTIVGGSVSIGLPFGRYLDDRALNVGTNRYSVVGQLGVSHKINRWTIESAFGVAWYADNDDLFGDRVLEQDPVGLFRGSLLYNLNRGMWVGGGFIYSYGGETTVEGVTRQDRMDNWRTGMALSIPIAPRHRVMLRFTNGVTSRIGGDFLTYGASYTYTF